MCVCVHASVCVHILLSSHIERASLKGYNFWNTRFRKQAENKYLSRSQWQMMIKDKTRLSNTGLWYDKANEMTRARLPIWQDGWPTCTAVKPWPVRRLTEVWCHLLAVSRHDLNINTDDSGSLGRAPCSLPLPVKPRVREAPLGIYQPSPALSRLWVYDIETGSVSPLLPQQLPVVYYLLQTSWHRQRGFSILLF